MKIHRWAIACSMVLGLLGWASQGATQGLQPIPAGPQPRPTYDSLQAGQDAYRAGEQQRAGALQQQLGAQGNVVVPNGLAVPYVSPPAAVYAYGGPRAARWGYRFGYGPWAVGPWPRGPGYMVARPYPWPPQGYVKIWTGPNGYIFRPIDPQQPLAPRATPIPQVPHRADPSTRPSQSTMPVPAPPIPEPPAQTGPQEF